MVMNHDSMKLAIDLINEIIFDIDETIYETKDIDDIRRLEYARTRFSQGVVQFTPVCFKCKNN